MNAVTQWLLIVALQSTILLIAFIGWMRWWNVNAFTKHTLSSVAITSCMLLPLGTLLVPATVASLLASPSTNLPAPTAAVNATDESPRSTLGSILSLPLLPSTSPAIAETAVRGALPQIPSNPFTDIRTWLSWDRAIVALWAIGFLVMITTRLVTRIKLQQLVRQADPMVMPPELREHLSLVFGRPMSPRLLVMDQAFVPFVIGLFKPAIVLPKMVQSDIELLKQVVTHEQAHIYRRDTWGLLWQQIVSAAFWWQPLLKLINRELVAARESIADSYVVSQCDPISYAENILRLAEAVHHSRPAALAFLNQPPTLEDRVRQVLTQSDPVDNRQQWSCRTLAVALSMIVLFLCGGVAVQSQLSAQEPAVAPKQTTAQTTTPPPAQATSPTAQPSTDEDDELHLGPLIQDDEPRFVTGRVLNLSGEPVGDCLMVAEVYTRDRKGHIISTRTDAHGAFKFDFPGNVRSYEPYYTWIYKQGYGLRAVAFGNKLARTHRWSNATIVLPVADRMTVQVQDPQGQPVADAVVEPISYQLPNGSFSADSPEGMVSDPPDEIIELVRAKTNAYGFVELNCFNAQLIEGLQVTSDTYGAQRCGSADIRNWKIRFSPVGSLRIKLVGADATKFKGVSLLLRSQPPDRNPPIATTYSETQATFDGQSELLIPKLPEGTVHFFNWSWTARKEYLPSFPTNMKINAGVETVVEIKMEPSIEVRGRVVLSDSLLPAKGVSLSLWSRGAHVDGMETDEQGNFSLYALPGPARLDNTAPGTNTRGRFRMPKSLSLDLPQATPLIVPDIVMEKVPDLKVHISDASGQPMIATEVIVAVQTDDRIIPFEKLKTASDGSVTTPLDFVEDEKRLRKRDPHSGFRFYLVDDYVKNEPKNSVPLKETRRNGAELWLKR